MMFGLGVERFGSLAQVGKIKRYRVSDARQSGDQQVAQLASGKSFAKVEKAIASLTVKVVAQKRQVFGATQPL